MINLDTVINQLNWRSAIKNFDPSKKVSDEDFAKLLETARLAPSSFGLQPWKLVVVKDKELRAKLLSAGYNQSQIVEASHLVVLCSPTSFGKQDVDKYVDLIVKERNVPAEALQEYKDMMTGFIVSKNQEDINNWMTKQVYIMLGVLLESCAMAGIDSCPMEGFDKAAFDEILGLKEMNLASQVICSIGYRSDSDLMSKAKKVRFPKEEFIVEI